MAGHNPAVAICGRLYVLMLALAAIGASVLLAFSCQMFSYRTTDSALWEGFSPPFDELATASVGLFSYSEVTTNDEDVLFGDQCTIYEDWQGAGQSVYFTVAQWCAIAAPIAGFLAWIQVFFDLIYCRLCGGFVLISLLFFAAAALQGCTFLVFADSEFCFEAESFNKCSFKLGAWYSLGAAIVYLVLAIIAPIVPIYPYEDRRGCCYVKGSPPKKGETTTSTIKSSNSSTAEEKPATKTATKTEPDVEAMEDYESASARGDFTDEDERTTNTNNEAATTVTEEEEAEKEESGFCGDALCFDNICGKKEEGTEVRPVKDGNE